MAKKTRATSRAAALDPTTVVEPLVGDLPDTASNNTMEPNMPEAAKEIPGTSDAATMATPNEDVKPEDKVQEKVEESESEGKVTEATQDDDADVPDLDLPSDDSQALIPEVPETSLDHDTQELDNELLEDARVEEIETEDHKDEAVNEGPGVDDNETEDGNRKRPLEAIQPSEVTPAKKLMSEVNQDGSVKTIQCEE